MEDFVSLFQSSQDRDCILNGWLIYQNWLETTLQSCILLNILTILIQCCCTDTMQFTSGKHRLKHISCIHRTVCLTGSDDRMKFIDKKNDLSVTVLHFFQNGFQTFLEFTTILCSCYQCSHIQRKDCLIFQAFRYISADDSLCKSFYNRSFTYTRFTDQHRVILCLTGQDTNHITDLFITSDDRIQFLISCFLNKILAVFIQCIISCFRIVRSNSLISSYC